VRVEAIRQHRIFTEAATPKPENAVDQPLAQLDQLDLHRRAKGRPKPKAS
jgi:hypothetical protein